MGFQWGQVPQQKCPYRGDSNCDISRNINPALFGNKNADSDDGGEGGWVSNFANRGINGSLRHGFTDQKNVRCDGNKRLYSDYLSRSRIENTRL